jgi:uncharacterized membrane protein HdeD (DUF308 family)
MPYIQKEIVIMNSFTLGAVDMKAVGQHWGWFLAKGILMILVGILALGDYVMVAFFSMIFLGWLMIFAGVVEAIHAFWKKEWGGLFLNLLVGVLYVVVGLMVLANPEATAMTLVFVMAIFFILDGIFRIIIAVVARFPQWGWMLFNGIITLILGLIIRQQWQYFGLRIIALFIGIDLIISGWTWVMLSLTSRRLAGDSPSPSV